MQFPWNKKKYLKGLDVMEACKNRLKQKCVGEGLSMKKCLESSENFHYLFESVCHLEAKAMKKAWHHEDDSSNDAIDFNTSQNQAKQTMPEKQCLSGFLRLLRK